LFFLFLVGTCEMQSIALSTASGASKRATLSFSELNTISLSNVSGIVKDILTKVQAKYEQNQKLGQQTLLDGGIDPDGLNRLFLIATFLLTMGTLLVQVSLEGLVGKLMDKVSQMKSKDATASDHSGLFLYGGYLRKLLGNFCFLASAAVWFQGFYFLVQSGVDNGDSIRLVGPNCLKLLASALFTIQPMTSIMKFNTPSDTSSGDFLWTNHYAMILFHIGNMISAAIGFRSTGISDLIKPTTSLPKISGLLFVLGTAFLLASDAKTVEQLGGTVESGNPLGVRQVLATAFPYVGHAFLLAGTILLMVKTS